ncbi:MAG: hypothetical protein WCQ54_07265 [Clostridiaceae bacterium]
MSYVVKSSEKTRKSGADTETKALLYLMNFRKDSDEIYFYIVDFFNDLTGMDTYSDKLWDLQSKGATGNSPKAIGKELVTLFKNYLSDFELRTCPPEKEKDFIQECQVALSKALFNKNSAESFWALLENVYGIIVNDPKLDVTGVFNKLDRNLAANRKSKWENTIKELNSLNRNIDVGELKCMDCNSKNISFSTSSKRTAYSFDISTVEMRNDIINSINNKMAAYDEEIEKYDAAILNEQCQLQELMKDDNITLEAIVSYKEQIFSASDAEKQIVDIDKKIGELQNKLIVSENSIEEAKNQREAIMEAIVKNMNVLYKKIDSNGNLVFDGLFTKKDEIFSGSEATIFHIVRMYAIQKMMGHMLPIIIDSFRAEDLSTAKEKIVIDEFNKLPNQVIFTTTLKDEEVGKYDNRQEINHIDYKDHIPSKMLSQKYCQRFSELLNDFAFEVL